ncbi:uncharacterized protein N7525_008259 [Penicillium rubens]|uniref:uncharacterized protein n=1 Tax=Penicillium rubens TaxID=1108849 RepID=UPI002A598A87|nr:uncharacterized protein N7525_008259 [Penicillium rubens]KAJ5830006.1 hypothetical protein N7525_008259 [Penicillium rubens]KAJ5853588.1 hypothetical protein N7534_006131 [Penicillium rubens]
MSTNKDLAGKVAINKAQATLQLSKPTLTENNSHRLQPGLRRRNSPQLAQRGADIAITYISNATAAESVLERIRTLGVRAIALNADVSQEEEVKPMFETLHREFGRLEIAVSSILENLSEVKGSDIDAIFAVNLKSQYFVAQRAFGRSLVAFIWCRWV